MGVILEVIYKLLFSDRTCLEFIFKTLFTKIKQKSPFKVFSVICILLNTQSKSIFRILEMSFDTTIFFFLITTTCYFSPNDATFTRL